MNKKEIIVSYLKYFVIIILCTLILTPIYIVFVTSFKTDNEFLVSNIFSLPDSFLYLDNFKIFIIKADLLKAFLNSAILVITSIIGNVCMGSMVAFILNRFEFKFKKIILISYVFASITPSVITEVTRFKLISNLGIYNTIWAGIVLFLATDLINIYIYLQFFDNIPKSIDESAMLDGASYFVTFRKILFPLLKPATASVIIIKGIYVYREMYIPYLYMPKKELRVVSTALMNFAQNRLAQWNIVSAGVILILIPSLIIYILLQKNIVSGLTSGSVKG